MAENLVPMDTVVVGIHGLVESVELDESVELVGMSALMLSLHSNKFINNQTKFNKTTVFHLHACNGCGGMAEIGIISFSNVIELTRTHPLIRKYRTLDSASRCRNSQKCALFTAILNHHNDNKKLKLFSFNV